MTLRLHSIKQCLITLENPKTPFMYYLYVFFASIILRIFFESYSQEVNHLNIPAPLLAGEMLHFTLFYMTMAFCLILLIHSLVFENINKISKVVLSGFIILLLAPLTDLLVSGGAGINIQYLMPGENHALLHAYFTYGSQVFVVSPGMKLEIMLLLVASYFYARYKNGSILRALALVFFIYTLLFCCLIAPYFVKNVQHFFGRDEVYSNESMINYYLILLFFLGSFTLFLQGFRFNGQQFILILVAECLLMITTFLNFTANDFPWLSLSLAMMSLVFIAYFFVFLASQRQIMWANIFLFAALFYAGMNSVRIFVIQAALFASLYLYLFPPFQLKKWLILRSLALSFCVLLLLLTGYLVSRENVLFFPHWLYWASLAGFTVFLELAFCFSQYLPRKR